MLDLKVGTESMECSTTVPRICTDKHSGIACFGSTAPFFLTMLCPNHLRQALFSTRREVSAVEESCQHIDECLPFLRDIKC